MPRVALMPPPTHDESKEEAVKISDEFKEAHRRMTGKGATPTKKTALKMLRGGLKEEREHAEHEYAAEDRVKMRQKILALRLFPNLFNKSFLLQAQGPN